MTVGMTARYTPTAQALHWLTAAIFLAVLPLAWVAEVLPDGARKNSMFVFHRSVGLTIFALVILRLLWRIRHPAPPLPASRALAIVSGINHWLLYAVLVLMPITGYLASSGGRVSYLGLFTLPTPPSQPWIGDTADTLHLLGQWAVYALVALHLLGAAWHVAVRRDGLILRMLPPQHPPAA